MKGFRSWSEVSGVNRLGVVSGREAHHDSLYLHYLFVQTVFSHLTLSVILSLPAVIKLKTIKLILSIFELNQ